ncbi:MAG: hypothetical protein KF799_07825 [Bdellovibrionales bacterium]|nr:hypothetical protein [Bdellovibrionales bacterium]
MKFVALAILAALTTTTAFADVPMCGGEKYSNLSKDVLQSTNGILSLSASFAGKDTGYGLSVITSGKNIKIRARGATFPAKICKKGAKQFVAVVDTSANLFAGAKEYRLTINVVSPTEMRITESNGSLNDTFIAN